MTVARRVTLATMKVATTQVWELLMTAQPASVRRYRAPGETYLLAQ